MLIQFESLHNGCNCLIIMIIVILSKVIKHAFNLMFKFAHKDETKYLKIMIDKYYVIITYFVQRLFFNE